MVQNMNNQNGQERNASNLERIKSGDLLEPTLSSGDNYYAIWTSEGTRTTAYAGGFGPQNRDYARGWSDLDLQNTVPGDIEGKARWVVYTDSQMDDPIAFSDTWNLSDLRASVSSGRTEKEVMPGLVPFAGQDRVLALEVSPASSSVGDTVSAADSTADLGIPYSQLR